MGRKKTKKKPRKNGEKQPKKVKNDSPKLSPKKTLQELQILYKQHTHKN